ncbi:hypothetical protein pEaSNUABM8_00291 [Erwinia phage pEa_SNUABM_8]|nr:hypothetical protein pEaSNUABM8_00291 [Erwinia phage pEa_SNUABM_8]QVW55043.1 hypothetical protein pEaSNUABM4_00290 [Erwinia phage pEa_SNUABM_4]
MYQLVDIIDIMVGDYDHCPTWKELNLSTRAVLDVGHSYKNNPVLVHLENGRATDFQILETIGDRLPVYINEPFSAPLRDELAKVLHVQTLVEKDAVIAVVGVENAASDIRANLVSMSVPGSVQKDAKFRDYCAKLINQQPDDTTMIIVVPYTEENMHEFLPRGFVIMDYVYFL